MPHTDFVYSVKLDIEVPADLMDTLANVTGSIIVDGLKKAVTARCGALLKNAVSIGFVQDLVAGNIDAAGAKEEYGRRIKADEAPDWYTDELNEKDPESKEAYLAGYRAKHAISAQDFALPAIGGALGAATGRTLFGGTDKAKTIATIAGLLAGAGGGHLLSRSIAATPQGSALARRLRGGIVGGGFGAAAGTIPLIKTKFLTGAGEVTRPIRWLSEPAKMKYLRRLGTRGTAAGLLLGALFGGVPEAAKAPFKALGFR